MCAQQVITSQGEDIELPTQPRLCLDEPRKERKRVVVREDGKEPTWILAVFLYIDSPILYLLLHCSQRAVFSVDFRGSRTQPLIRIQYDKAQSSLTLLGHRHLKAKETVPA